MCGIAGIVDFGGRPADDLAAALARMHDAIAHRGPDGEGRVYLHGDTIEERLVDRDTHGPRPSPSAAAVYLAHRRLAIIDLSPGGHQPMRNGDASSWLVYNGELYNYRDLRASIASPQAFRSASDTEVLLALLDARGVEGLASLRGMFAFAYWDERRRRLLLARDRFGLKPLLFARPAPDLVCFASEPQALLTSGLVPMAIEASREAEFLERGAIGADRSSWRGLDAVAPGEWAIFEGTSITRGRYWSLDEVLLEPRPQRDAGAVAAVVREALTESVAAHLVSDVPVGVFLSGGLDSAAILAAAARVSPDPVRTFTITMDGGSLDEAADARATAAHFHSEHVELPAGELALDAALDEFFAAMQEPTIDGFNTFIVARAARAAGLSVVLSGVGGDEALGGYPSFVDVPALARWMPWARPAVRAAAPILRRWPAPRAQRLIDVADSGGEGVEAAWWAYHAVLRADEARALSGGEMTPQAARERHGADEFDLIRALEFQEFLERQLLRDADAFTMCRALELRTPFVDHVFIERVAEAGRWRRAAGESFKRTLFAARPELARPALAAQPKRGFVLPFDRWIRAALAGASPSAGGDLRARLSEPAYRPWVARFLAGRLHWSRLWAIYVFDRCRARDSSWTCPSSSSRTTRAITSARV